MSLSVTLQNLANLVRVAPSRPDSTSPVGRSAGSAGNRANLLQAQQQLFALFESIVRLDTAVNGKSSLRLDLPVARSEPAPGLDLNSYSARLQASDEVNATPTSFAPFGPDWDGASTSLLTVSGIYDGSDGNGEISFEVRRGGERGVDRPRIRARDPLGNIIRTFTVRENHALDRLYSLNNGLSVTVGEGFLINRDTTRFSVFDAVGSAVDPALSFDGLRNVNPNLQFDLPSVRDGSFQLNDETISVTTADSINSVISRINQSAAGVTASFDPASERVELVQNTPGATPTISLSSDTSRLLENLKLTSATLTPGKDPDNQRPLAELGLFAAAQSGSFEINGTAIDLDVANDSLDDVLARINASGAGATASFDNESGQVTLQAASGVGGLEIDSNATGLFAALNLPEGRVDPQARQGGVSERRLRAIGDAVAGVADGLNQLFSNRGLLNGRDSDVIALRNQLEAAVTRVLGGEASRLDSGIGLKFDRSQASQERGEFVSFDRRKLALFLQKRGSQVRAFFNGRGEQLGLSNTLAGAVEGVIRKQAASLGSRGTLFDARA